jgi:hypothetical protein
MACSGFPCFMFNCKSNSNFVSLLNDLLLYAIGDVCALNGEYSSYVSLR